MRLRSLFAVLLLLALGNNALLPSFCAAHCAPPAANAHHYQMTFERGRESIERHRQDEDCNTDRP